MFVLKHYFCFAIPDIIGLTFTDFVHPHASDLLAQHKISK